MSEKNNNIFENDLMMRAILESGQEEVPGRVWDAVSERLDAAEAKKARKPVTLWWGRAAMAVAAVAAAVATVILVDRGEDQVEMVPRSVQGDMIAVVEPEPVASPSGEAELLAYIPETPARKPEIIENEIPEEISTDVIHSENTPDSNAGNTSETVEKAWQSFDDWEDEDETPARKIKTAITVSGLTEAAQQQSGSSSGMLKAPSLVLAPSKTGIKEKESQTRYGIPVSVGAGVRFEFTPRWSLGVGLNYTLLTRTFHGTYTHVAETGSIDNLITSDIRNSQHYLGLPINAFFNIINSKDVHFYTYAGGTVEKCISDRYHVQTNHIIHKEKVDGVQLSAAVGLGAEFALTKHLGLYLDPSLRYYFDCDQPKSIRTAQPLMFAVEAGLRFRL